VVVATAVAAAVVGVWWWLVVVGGGVIVTECVYLCVYRVQGRGNAMLLERIQDDG